MNKEKVGYEAVRKSSFILLQKNLADLQLRANKTDLMLRIIIEFRVLN